MTKQSVHAARLAKALLALRNVQVRHQAAVKKEAERYNRAVAKATEKVSRARVWPA